MSNLSVFLPLPVSEGPVSLILERTAHLAEPNYEDVGCPNHPEIRTLIDRRCGICVAKDSGLRRRITD
jgi:hypothetical protein